MINYRKKISIKQLPENKLVIETDMSSIWNTTPVLESNAITTWWKNQYQSELRSRQKEYVMQFPSMATGKIIPYLIWKTGMGYKQNHDMSLCFSPRSGLYFFSTMRDYWIYPRDKSGTTILTVDMSLGSIEDKDQETEIYDIIFTVLRPKFNPLNEVLHG